MSNKKTSFYQWDRTDWLILLIVAIPIITFIFFYQELPEQMAIHFGSDGEPDGYQGKLSFFITISLLLIIIPLGLKIFSKIDPRKENYAKFERAFNLIRLTVALLLSVALFFVLLINLEYAVNIQLVASFGVGVLFLVMGNYLGQIRPTYFIGIRTPWTLANKEVWRRTHRLAGPLMMLTGLVFLITAFLPSSLAIWVSSVSIMIFVLVPTIYSYVLFSRIGKEG